MQQTDRSQKETAAMTSLELTLLSDTHTLYNRALNMRSQDIRLLFTGH